MSVFACVSVCEYFVSTGDCVPVCQCLSVYEYARWGVSMFGCVRLCVHLSVFVNMCVSVCD